MYALLKIWVRAALWLYAKDVRVVNMAATQAEGPLVLAANHPNSFFDALLLGVAMRQPVTFIARGDVFRRPWIAALLQRLHMIPIYRMRDGKDKLQLNDITFTRSTEVLEQGGILLIFVEGICMHQTELLTPLKKGAPRIVYDCWQQHIPVKVLPVWLQYSSFTHIGKTIHLRMGNAFDKAVATEAATAPQAYQVINEATAAQLLHLQNAIPFTHKRPSGFVFFALALPALAGALLHAPLYLPVCRLAAKLNNKDVHYDGLVLALLMVLYPVYVSIITALLAIFFSNAWLWLFTPFIMLATARCFIVWKK